MRLGARILTGISWSIVSQSLRMLLQLATIPILARILSPDDFGVYAMALPVVGLAGLLQDFGLQQALVQKDQPTKDQLNNVYWLNFGISTCVAVAMLASSPFVAGFYSEPRLKDLIAAFSILAILGAVGFGQYALLNRNLRFRTIALIDMCCAVVTFVTVIVLGLYWRSYWALWAGGLASVIAWIALSFLTGNWRPGIPRLGVKLEGMFQFGFHIMLHNAANYATRNVDTILIGRYFGAVSLGFYDRAYKILLYPLENLAHPVSRVMVPLLSRVRNEPGQFRRAFVNVSGLVNLACIPGLAAAIGCSHEVVRILLGEKWIAVAPIFFWLGFAGLVQPLIISANWVLIAEGRSRDLMRISLISSVIVVGGFIVGPRWGPVGVAASYALVEIFFRVPFTVVLAGKGGLIQRSDFLQSLIPILGAAALTIIFAQWIAEIVSGWRLLAVMLPAAYLIAFAALALSERGRVLIRTLLGIRGLIAEIRSGKEEGVQ